MASCGSTPHRPGRAVRPAAAGWSCQTVPDERAALENEIGRLQGENAELKKSLLRRGIELPPGVMAEAPVPTAGAAGQRAGPVAEGAQGAEAADRGRSRPRHDAS